MTRQGIVQENSIGQDRIAYSITPKGISLLHTFKEFKKLLPDTNLTSNQLPVYLELIE